MENLSKKIVNIKYKKLSDFKILPATGAFGGSTPQREILCNFYVEYKDAPDSLQLEINPVDSSTKEIGIARKDLYIRELNIGVLMRPDIAKIIGEWLVEQANSLMKKAPKLNS